MNDILNYFLVDPSWILPFRNDYLTNIFKLFPILASDYFYISIIALGYWLRPQKLLFVHLGFLILFSTLLNGILKNLFTIPRPPTYLHLITVHDFGFPSGDVQVGTVFWLYIFLVTKTSILRYLCILPIIGIAMSRVYLGVHSIYDVLGGILVGFLIVRIWNKSSIQYSSKTYWWTAATTFALYVFISQNLAWQKSAIVAIGALLGFCSALPQIKIYANSSKQEYNYTNFISLFLCYIIIVLMTTFIPIIKTEPIFLYTSLTLKYFVLLFAAFALVPKFRLWLFSKKASIILISDPVILAIPIRENNEPMVDLKEQNTIILGPSPEIPDNTDYTKMRKAVYEKLVAAQNLLPSELKFCLYEGYRSLSLQEKLFTDRYNKVKQANPTYTHAQIFIETTKLVSPVINLDGSTNIPPHSTGAAIDVYLLDSNGTPVDMGIHPKDWTEDLNGVLSITYSACISTEAKKNRNIMSKVLNKVGFVNYTTEYWHWSYGDRYWAYHKNQEYALYNYMT